MITRFLPKFAFLIVIYIVACFLIPFKRAYSQTPDWSTSVASIIYEHCSHCHHENAIAPFPLMSYEDAVLWGMSIQTQINAGLMPPWPPDPNYSHLMNENVLSEDEINTINLWVNNGMPSGNLNLAPAAPIFNGGSIMVNPDEVIYLPVFTIPEAGDVYWNFANPSGYTQTKYLNSVEFVAGNPSVVHHLLFAMDSSGVSSQDDSSYPGPGYPRDNGTSTCVSSFIGQSEGRVITLPSNIGFEIPAGSDYVTEIHYYNDSLGNVDSSKVNVKFCTVPDVRSVKTDMLLHGTLPSLLDGPLQIPANTVKTFHMVSGVFSEDQSLLGLSPHAHLICHSWLVYMVTPSGDTIPLISIPNWDFDWQGCYLLTKVIKIPQGSQIYGTAVYDNTINNPDNPSNPPQDVSIGATRLDEMAQVRFWLMDYQPGDEDIILDSAFYGISTNNSSIEKENFLNLFPNPASQSMTVEYKGSNTQEVHVFVYNNLGELLFNSVQPSVGGNRSFQLDCTAFASGIYLLSVRSKGEVSNENFVIAK